MQTKTQAPAPSSSQPLTSHRGFQYKAVWDWLLVRSRLRLAWSYLVGTWRIYSAAIGSLRGHIRLQSPTNIFPAGTGKALIRGRNQSLQPNIRTQARATYIEMLWATMDWVDSVDLRIFLMGFDAGEQWTLHTMGSENETPIEVLTWASSNKTATQKHITIDMLKRQWYKSQYESARPGDSNQSG